MVLGLCVDLLFVTMLYESFYTASVPSSISVGATSQSLLHLDGRDCRILSCDIPHFGLRLCSGRIILEPNYQRHLRKPQGCVVSQSLDLKQRRSNLMFHLRFTNASINIVTDICTGVLPLPTLNSLNLPRRQKYALMAVFALGGWYVA